MSRPNEEAPETQSGTEPTITVPIEETATIQLRLTNDDAEATSTGTINMNWNIEPGILLVLIEGIRYRFYRLELACEGNTEGRNHANGVFVARSTSQ